MPDVFYVSVEDITIYHIIAGIIILLIIWYIVKINMLEEDEEYLLEGMNDPSLEIIQNKLIIPNSRVDPLDFKFTDSNYQFGPLEKGIYGNVPVYYYEDADIPFTPQWRQIYGGNYLPNPKLYYRETVIPIESFFWLGKN